MAIYRDLRQTIVSATSVSALCLALSAPGLAQEPVSDPAGKQEPAATAPADAATSANPEDTAKAEPLDALELTDWLDWERAAGPVFAKDGSSILYTRRHVDKYKDRWSSEIWQMDGDGRRHRFLIKGGNVQWAPTGDRIAFVATDGDDDDAKPQLKVRYMDAEGAVSTVTRENMAPIDYSWSPDGSRIAFRAEVPMEPEMKISLPGKPKGANWKEDPLVVERLHYREDRVGNKTGFDHIFVVPADGGTPRQITDGRFDVGARFSGQDSSGRLEWTPDGSAILFDGIADPARELDGMASDINRVDLSTVEITRVQPEDGYWRSPRISPDGQMIAYTGNIENPVNYPTPQLRVMGADGSNDRVLIDNLPDGISMMEWAPDGQGLYFSMNHDGATDLFFVDMEGSQRQITDGMHRFYTNSFMFGAEGAGKAVGILSSPMVTPNVATVDLATGNIAQMTDLNADILEGVTLGEVREVNYKSADGTDVQGWLVLPPDYKEGTKYPLVLSIHGGPHGMYGVNFQFRFQDFASRGYAVLYTNPRGSTGYTPEFANAIDNAYPGRADYEDLMGGVDYVIEQGIVDSERLYVTGCSGGGVLTTWTVTQTDRFKAAAALCPVTNWISFAGQADIGRWSFARFRPFFWEDPTNWLEHSPIMHVQNVSTPTMLMTGAEDLRTPLAQAEEFYAALKMRGVDTILISMAGEYHGTTSIPSNMLRTQLYLSQWFAKYGGVEMDKDTPETAAP